MLAFMMPGPTEMIVIGVVMVLLFGNRLPSVMRSVGGSVTSFKKGLKDVDPTEDIREVTNDIKKELK